MENETIDKRAKKRAGGGARLGEQKNWGKVGRGEQEGGGGGEKRNHLKSITKILPNSVRPRMGSNSAI